MTLEVFGKGNNVVDQFPKAGTEILSTQRIYVAMQSVDQIQLPNLIGRSLRDAVEACSFFKVDCQTSGEGYVSDQNISGDGESRSVTLQLKPLSLNEKGAANPASSPTPSPDAASAQKPTSTPVPNGKNTTTKKSP
ncbi:hypothetical protein [Paenibacillus sp. N3.4]|uniref:hypothetical protein n=1 Tax=Paenibacillus sp. N3.4 TaxID=2603222 RepID=UPI00164FDB30|nr:hypothetical protein [Paenibacillus sp. N3.4]